VKIRHLVFGLVLLLSGFIAWAVGAFAGRPCSPASSIHGTERIFPAAQPDVAAAITNAFDLFRYHGLMLTDPIGSDWMARDYHPTNGFLLLPTTETLCTVQTLGFLGKRHLPYEASFHITLMADGTNRTRVVVRTVTARAVNGLGLGPCGPCTGSVRVRPIRREEENVIDAIGEKIVSSRST